MIGLEQQVELRRNGKHLDFNEKVSYSNIGKIIHKTHSQVMTRIKNNSFSVTEALKIYEQLEFRPKNDYNVFKYLFSKVEED